MRPFGITTTINFTKDWKYSNVHEARGVDLLHELLKGVFGTGLFVWIQEKLNDEGGKARLKEFDDAWGEVPFWPGLKIFKKGVTTLQLVQGTEFKEMIRQMVCVLQDKFTTNRREILSLRAFIHFYYLISAPSLSSATIQRARTELMVFNGMKDVWLPYSDLLFPKMHSLSHYLGFVTENGTALNTDTSVTEAKHKMDAKQPYQDSNRTGDVMRQMIKSTERRLGMTSKLIWLRKFCFQQLSPAMKKAVDSVGFGKIEGSCKLDEPEQLLPIPAENDEEANNDGEDIPQVEVESVTQTANEDDMSTTNTNANARIFGSKLPGNPCSAKSVALCEQLPFDKKLREYLSSEYDLPYDFDNLLTVWCYQNVSVSYPGIFDEKIIHTNRLRACKSWRSGRPRYDCALIDIGEPDQQGHLQYDIVRIRMLFEYQYWNNRTNTTDKKQLAFVERFNKVIPTNLFMDIGWFHMLEVAACTTGGEIIDVRSIARGAHLVPRWSTKGKRGFDIGGYSSYYVNSHIDTHMYHTFY